MKSLYVSIGKRAFDIAVAMLALLFCAPILLIAFVGIKLDTPGPIFFFQTRVGKDFVPFKIYKLRTMTNESRSVGASPILGKSEGVTLFGYYLRRFKIDELPQLINVLVGHVSLVGPRPSVFEQLDSMTEKEKMRYTVRPGLTGLAQVSGNIYLPWKERFQLDLIYIDRINLINDLRILWRTVAVVIRGESRFVQNPIELKK